MVMKSGKRGGENKHGAHKPITSSSSTSLESELEDMPPEFLRLIPPADVNNTLNIDYSRVPPIIKDEEKIDRQQQYFIDISEYLSAFFGYQSPNIFIQNLLSHQSGLEGYLAGIRKKEPKHLSIPTYEEGYSIGLKIVLHAIHKIQIPEPDFLSFRNGFLKARYNLNLESSKSPHYLDGEELGKRELERNKAKHSKYKLAEEGEEGYAIGFSAEMPLNWKSKDFMINYTRGMLDFLAAETNYKVPLSTKDVPQNPIQYIAFMNGFTQMPLNDNLMDLSMHSWKSLPLIEINGVHHSFGNEQKVRNLQSQELDEKVKWYQIGKRIRTQSQEAQQ